MISSPPELERAAREVRTLADELASGAVAREVACAKLRQLADDLEGAARSWASRL
jgi:hypothetical protein